MKRTVRMVCLMVGLFCAYTAIAAPVATTIDGAPVPVCTGRGCR